ncbi:hypothetical protein PR202_gb25886 [Eleusine coracana subsp. coracana]|uniref:Uncharacterized protein n=1 Tax=Eleusine coracana subsp. coracana TaxID=191504 RepID=A0AAV5FPU4_ELECO|nr:hypothetical protein PR202_gb25886 [Eleusine coracana subsp. coracana]
MTARRIRVTGFKSIQQPYEHSAVTVLSWPTTCTFAWPRRHEPGSPSYPTIPSVPGRISIDSSSPTFKPPSTG